ncbi:MAG: PilZ domain-containing protein [Rhodospirillaceae bacterium]|nr:PilZ domain-containing protein [Rhodospirillaceae bacterium]MBT6084495.1 PilZ domain-containing protein [Rhodospirillaceae bacterium]
MAQFQVPNRRREDRKAVLFRTSLVFGGIGVDCDVLDIGSGGVRVAASLQAASQTSVTLAIDQLGDFQARIAWNRGGEIGLKFDEPPERINQALEVIALYGTS